MRACYSEDEANVSKQELTLDPKSGMADTIFPLPLLHKIITSVTDICYTNNI
jgi:hypothetical protein